MSRPSLALALICKNEAHNFPVLFDSIKDCFDEVHVTDTGSTDGTIEYLSDLVKSGKDKVVLGCPLKLHFFEWVHDFGAARNASFKNIQTDFVMWMDLDDVLSNRDNFILWRDTAMGLADYWLATYHYAFDDQQKPVCSFARERVVRNAGKDVWQYFVHEGIRPLPGWKPQYAMTWAIHHRRSPQDIQKDKGRNLGLFEKNKSKLDTRMIFYHGKELFEAGRPMEAFSPLMEAISRPDLEPHDRILGIQYACYSALQCKQPEKAIELAHQGLRLDQNRAEFYSVLGDAYIQTGNLKGAVPFYAAAKNCFNSAPQGGRVFGAIFNHHTAYGAYPTEQLAKIYYSMGDLDRAERECVEAEKFNSEPCKKLLEEIRKGKSLIVPDQAAVVGVDEIVFTSTPTGPYPWDSKLYKENGLGGSETACVEMATWLAKKTRQKVIVYNPRETSFTDEHGVEYRPIKDVLSYFSKFKPKLHIAWRHNSRLTDAPTYHWCHDLVLPGAESGVTGDAMLCLTEFHRDYVRSMQGVPLTKILMTRNGIDYSRFEGLRQKNQNKIIFSSSPDRGLDRAILVVEEARKKLPNLEMHVFYGLENLEKYGLAELAKKLKAMIAERPWVKYHGNVEQKILAQEMMSSACSLYVPDFIESFFLTGLELMAAGCYLVTRKIGAIQNTMKPFKEMGLCTVLDMAGDTEEQRKVWAKELIDAIEKKKWMRNDLDTRFWTQYSWESVADEWIEMFDLKPKLKITESYEKHLEAAL